MLQAIPNVAMKTEIKEGNFELTEKLGARLACLIKQNQRNWLTQFTTVFEI